MSLSAATNRVFQVTRNAVRFTLICDPILLNEYPEVNVATPVRLATGDTPEMNNTDDAVQ